MKRVRFVKEEHSVYDSVEEAVANGIRPREGDWREAEVGDWVVADDGCVIQVLRKYPARKGFFFVLPCGTFTTESRKLTTEPKSVRSTVSGKLPYVNDGPMSKKTKIFIDYLLEVYDPKLAYKLTYGKHDYSNLQRMLSSPKVKEEIVSRIQDKCSEIGLTEEYILTKLKEIIEESKVSDRLQAIKLACLLLGLEREARGSMIEGKAVFSQFTVLGEAGPAEALQQAKERAHEALKGHSTGEQAPEDEEGCGQSLHSDGDTEVNNVQLVEDGDNDTEGD